MKKKNQVSKSPKRKGKVKKTQIKGQPIHLNTPKGIGGNWPSTYGVLLISKQRQELTLNQSNAFRKSISKKNMRKLFSQRTRPFLELTKKPAQVRMGKGRGTKINRTIAPLLCGSIVCEVYLNIRQRRPKRSMISALGTFRRGMRKLPPDFRIRNMDI